MTSEISLQAKKAYIELEKLAQVAREQAADAEDKYVSSIGGYMFLLHRYECSTEKQTTLSIRNYIRDTSEIFSISSLVKLSLTSFLCFLSIFLFSKHSYLCHKKKITHWFEHRKFIFSWKKRIDFMCSHHRVISSVHFSFH